MGAKPSGRLDVYTQGQLRHHGRVPWTIQKRDRPADDPLNSATVMCKNCSQRSNDRVPLRRSGSPMKKRWETQDHPAGAVDLFRKR